MIVDLMLMLTPLTRDRLDADRKAYINDATSLGGISILGIALAVVSAVLLILVIVFIVKACKCRREGAAKIDIMKNVVGSVLLFFLLLLTGSAAGEMIASPLLSKLSFNSHETKVVCATITEKSKVEFIVSDRTNVNYMITTDDGQEYIVSKDTYDDAEEGGTYYFVSLTA